jgi:Flp pilus assembly protein TadG
MRADSIKGSAAVEFAMIAPVFFVLLMGTIETGVIFFAQSALQNAVNDAARMVRTGQAMTQASFRTQVCSEVSTLLSDCNGASLQFDINAYSGGFGGATNSSPLDANGNLPTLTNFTPGNPCDVVLVRAFYKWKVWTPALDYFLGTMPGGYHLLATAAAFRNEPFNNNVAGCT